MAPLVETSDNGIEALLAVERLKPDLLFIDLNIPGVDGFQMIGILNGKAGYEGMTVVVVSGLSPDELAQRGTELISPHRQNRLPENKTQDGRPLRRYKRRWKVERTIAWLQNFRRLCIRWEKSTMLFQGFLHLGCTMLLLKAVLG
jgi:CheY-like chemotaxis protein